MTKKQFEDEVERQASRLYPKHRDLLKECVEEAREELGNTPEAIEKGWGYFNNHMMEFL